MELKTTIEFFKDMQADIREMEYSDANEAAIMNALSEGYFKDAIDALEKQVPHKLEKLKTKRSITVCGVCRGIMDSELRDLDYCPNCGQAIDWSEVEE